MFQRANSSRKTKRFITPISLTTCLHDKYDDIPKAATKDDCVDFVSTVCIMRDEEKMSDEDFGTNVKIQADKLRG